MIEQIIVPQTNDTIVHVPDELLGKRVRVRMEVEPEILAITQEELQQRVQKLRQYLEERGMLFDTTTWRFDRDEATNYD